MKISRWVLSLAVVAALLLTLVLPAAADVVPPVQPPEVKGDLGPGESMTVEKRVTTPPIPPVVDIFLLQDETGSMGDDIATLKALAPQIWDAVAATGIDFTMGVGGLRDFDQSFWGSPGDWVYRLPQDLTKTKSDFVNGVNALTAWGGADWPEAQLEALHYAANPGHAAIDSNGDGDTTDPGDTPVGLQPAWRSGAQRIILLATDAPVHVTGDAGGWPGDAGTASVAATVASLNAAGITVIGLVPGGAGAIPDIDALAAGTGGTVQNTGASGEDVKEAILKALKELTTDVWWTVTADPGLTVTLAPDVYYDVKGGTTLSFTETITVAKDAPQCHTLTATVIFWANSYPKEGAAIGKESITVKVKDITKPEVASFETANPAGKKIPPAGSTTDPGPKGGMNEDGFYVLKAWDNCDKDPMIYVVDRTALTPSWDGIYFGPFPSGTVVKFTEAKGAVPVAKKIGSTMGKAGYVDYHIILPTDAVVVAVDASGNWSWEIQLVPPPPK